MGGPETEVPWAHHAGSPLHLWREGSGRNLGDTFGALQGQEVLRPTQGRLLVYTAGPQARFGHLSGGGACWGLGELGSHSVRPQGA